MDKEQIKIAIIDYQMGNLFSIKRACEHVGLIPVVTSAKSVVREANGIILPGVGAFGDAMDNLRRLDLIEPIKDFIGSSRPFMGICLGLQLLMSESEEFGSHDGLDIIRGSVVRFPNAGREGHKKKVPQVGWNRIYPHERTMPRYWEWSPLKDIETNTYMYFVHSYYAIPEESGVILSCTDYEGTEYASSFFRNNVFACQFHPEKSGYEGLRIYSTWAKMLGDKRKMAYE